MKIAGLALPQFIGAIIVGLILSFVLISILVPTDVKPEAPKPVVTKSCGMVGVSSAWNASICSVNDSISAAYNMAILLVIIIMIGMILALLRVMV